MKEPETLLLVALSARALAAAAVRAGFGAVTVDFFADEDTREIAPGAQRLDGPFDVGFEPETLMRALDRAIAATVARDGRAPRGIIAGTGFEDRPELLDRLGDLLPLLGNDASAVARAKRPDSFAEACRALEVPCPERTDVVPHSGSWLRRRIGGSGGAHVRPADPGPVPAGFVAERWMPGTPVSAAVLSTGKEAAVIGLTQQWSSPTASAPFRFAGVVGPVALAPAVEVGLTRAAVGLVQRLGLCGLVSVDALVEGDAFWVLEVNPRPGASLDVLDATDPPLMACHVAAFEGRLLAPRLHDATIRASLVAYAAAETFVPVGVDWPGWVHDRPAAGSIVAGAPVATVCADGKDPVAARRAAEQRERDLFDRLEIRSGS